MCVCARVYMCMHVDTCMYTHTHKGATGTGWRTVLGGWFSPPAMWVLGIKLRLSVLKAGGLTHRDILDWMSVHPLSRCGFQKREWDLTWVCNASSSSWASLGSGSQLSAHSEERNALLNTCMLEITFFRKCLWNNRPYDPLRQVPMPSLGSSISQYAHCYFLPCLHLDIII